MNEKINVGPLLLQLYSIGIANVIILITAVNIILKIDEALSPLIARVSPQLSVLFMIVLSSLVLGVSTMILQLASFAFDPESDLWKFVRKVIIWCKQLSMLEIMKIGF